MRTDHAGHDADGAAGLVMTEKPLRIVHCFREPAGGLFRHVRDLVELQQRAGHAVGVICDSTTGGPFEEELLRRLAPHLALGLKRFPMRRQIAPSDLAATLRLMREVRSLDPDILHGHGAKGGAYARVIGTLLRASGIRVARIYSPHGGSLHYDPAKLAGRVYFAAERIFARMTDAFIFVSQFEADTYKAPDARDFLFIGTLRDLKGPDVFIRALALVAKQRGRAPTAWIVGDGEEKPRYEGLVRELGLEATTSFHPAMPVREGFALARTVIVPSRAESMPYIILEAVAAGMPLIATRVGGIPEIFGAETGRLVPPGDAEALAAAMAGVSAAPDAARAAAFRLRGQIRAAFSVEAMAAAITAVYRSVTVSRRAPRPLG